MKHCDTLLRIAAWLAPHDVRRDWLREWRAEVASAGRRSTSGLIWRCLGAFVHAAWLRWDRWRMEMLLQDLKYALRTLVRKPGFATLTVLTLAIGIGANAAIFSAVRAVVLRPLPYPHPEQLVQISTTRAQGPQLAGGASSPPDFTDWRRESASFQEIAAISTSSLAWSGHAQAEQVPSAMVTGAFFHVLDVKALHGRTLTFDDDKSGSPDVVVVSHALWVRRLGADPGVVGRTLILDQAPRRIVGVLSPGISYPLGSELWLPLRFTADTLTTQRGAQYLDVIGRLRAGVTRGQAQAEMSALAARMAAEYPRTNATRAVAVFELRDAIVGNVRPALLVLLGAVGFVMLIVCANVASLALTRAVGRSRELAVRAALGAGRGRLVSGMLAESALLTCGGAALGLLLASWATQGLAALDDALGIPLLDETRIDLPVALFTLAASALAAVLVGTVPAWHAASRLDVVRRIREGAGTVSAGKERQRLRSGLIVVETALAVVLLVGAGLLMRSFLQITGVTLGFETSRIQTFSVSLPEAKYETPAARAAFVETVTTQLAALPDIETAAAVFGLPLTRFSHGYSTSSVDGRALTDAEQDARIVQVRVVTPDYFKVLGIPIARGRAFLPGDRLGTAPVAIVDQRAAALLWPDTDPIGRHFTVGSRLGQGGERAGGAVVGVAQAIHDLGPTGRLRPTVYLAHAQFPMDFVTFAAKARGEAAALAEPARALLATMDPDLPMFRVRTMEQLTASAVAQPRFYLLVIALFAGTAILLAAVGIYGVLTHAVAQRTREIGIRLALGAPRGAVVASVVRQATVLAVVGLGLGLLVAVGASRFVAALLFQIEPSDALTYAVVAAGLLTVALLASYLPARRAARIDPMTALRSD